MAEQRYRGVMHTNYTKPYQARIYFKKNDKRPPDNIVPSYADRWTIGFYDTPEEAAKAYDAFIDKWNLSHIKNFDEVGNRIPHEKDKLFLEHIDFIMNYYKVLDIADLAEITGLSKNAIRKGYREYKDTYEKQIDTKKKKYGLVVLTSEEIYDKLLGAQHEN